MLPEILDCPYFLEYLKGIMHDSKLFPGVMRKLIHRFFKLTRGVGKVTLIFDKGNNSKKNFTFLEEEQISFVGSLVPTQHKDLLKIPLEDYEEIILESGVLIKAKRMTKKVFGKERVVVITFNQALQKKQTLSLEKRIQKAEKELKEVDWKRIKKPKEKIDEILSKRKICGLLKVIREKDKFSIERNLSAISERMLSFGKNTLFTDREDLTTKEIISLYKDKCEVEECFKRLKDNTHISFTPPYHWTDSKIRVQAFICVLALILLKLLKLEAHLQGIDMSIPLLLEELQDIREIVVFSQHDKVVRKISQCSPIQRRLFSIFDLEKVAKELGIQPPYS